MLNSKLAQPNTSTRPGTSSIGSENRLNSKRQFNRGGYRGGALETYGFDAGYNITPELTASVGYYYQQGDLGEADGSGVKGRLAFADADDVEFGGTYTYDNAFNARASADLTIRFGGGSHKEKSNEQAKAEEQPQIKELSATPSNRDVRVQDGRPPCRYDGAPDYYERPDAAFRVAPYPGFVNYSSSEPNQVLQKPRWMLKKPR